MSFVVEGAPQGYGPQLDLFEKRETETGILERYYKEIKPSGVFSANAALEFNVNNDSPDFIDVSRIKFQLEYDIVNDQGNPIEDWDKCGPVNNPIATFFNQFDFMLDQKNLSLTVGANYPYKAIFDILISKGVEYRSTVLAMGGFIKDTSEFMDDATCFDNLGLRMRREMTTDKKTAQLLSYLYTGFAYQDKLLVNGVPISLKFHPTADKFRLMWPTPPKPSTLEVDTEQDDPMGFTAPPKKKQSEYFRVRFKDASVFIPFVKVHPGYLMQMSETIKNKPIVYEIDRSDIKAFSAPQGNYDFVGDNLFNDLIPKKLIVGMVSGKAYSGDNQSNPLNFQHFDATEINFQVNGQNINIPLKLNYEANHFFHAYCALMESLSLEQKEMPDISLDESKKGYTVYVFDMEKTKEPSIRNTLSKGASRLTIRFGKALPEPVNVICYGVFDSFVTVDEPRNVIIHNG